MVGFFLFNHRVGGGAWLIWIYDHVCCSVTHPCKVSVVSVSLIWTNKKHPPFPEGAFSEACLISYCS
jgi:hypothetical protein